MSNIYTKEYIEYVLEMDFVKFSEGFMTYEPDLSQFVTSWLHDLEPAVGEDEDAGYLGDEPASIIESIYEQVFESGDSAVNTQMQLSGVAQSRTVRAHDFNDESAFGSKLLSDVFVGSVKASLFSEYTDISYSNHIQSVVDPANKILFAQDIIEDPVNVAPEAIRDFFATILDTRVTGNLFADNGYGADLDVDGDALSALAGTFTTSYGGSVTISANGDFVYTSARGYAGLDSFSYSVVDSKGARDVAQVDVHVSNGDVVTHIDFSTATITDYGVSHNFSDDFYVLDDGATLHMENNTWKDVALTYTVTANTVIEFDYFSTGQGEIQGLGFDRDDEISEGYTFKVYGTQDWGNSAYETYAGNEGEWVHYKIEVGDFYTGSFSRLFFVNDDDQYVDANGTFSNVAIYEPGTEAADTMTGSSGSQTLMGLGGDDLIYGMDGDDILYGGSGMDFLFGGSGADRFVFEDVDDVDYVQDFNAAEGDVLDISALLVGYDALSDAIADFVSVTRNGTDTDVYVDVNGGADDFVHVATLYGVSDLGSVESLEDSGTLVTI